MTSVAGGAICGNKWVRLGSREEAQRACMASRMLNVWLGRDQGVDMPVVCEHDV